MLLLHIDDFISQCAFNVIYVYNLLFSLFNNNIIIFFLSETINFQEKGKCKVSAINFIFIFLFKKHIEPIDAMSLDKPQLTFLSQQQDCPFLCVWKFVLQIV